MASSLVIIISSSCVPVLSEIVLISKSWIVLDRCVSRAWADSWVSTVIEVPPVSVTSLWIMSPVCA